MLIWPGAQKEYDAYVRAQERADRLYLLVVDADRDHDPFLKDYNEAAEFAQNEANKLYEAYEIAAGYKDLEDF